MSDIVLKIEDLGISFGGLKAVDDVNLEIKKGELYGNERDEIPFADSE